MEKKLLIIKQRVSGCLLTLCFLLAGVGFAQAQSRLVTGSVIDDKGETLAGVSVQVKGTTKGAIANGDGKYSIEVSSPSDVLVFSFIGYLTQESEVGSRTTIDITLVADVETLSEVVVTGYQTQRKSDLTGAVAVIDMSKSKDNPSGGALQNIQGKVPGVYIQVNGSPSGGASQVNIRGNNTLGNTNPLYVIDGVPTLDPNAFQFMDQNSIESIQVLKDASAASIYGSRASNGVIIVTTKQGKENISITVNSSVSVSYNARRLDMMNTQEYGSVLWQATVNDFIRNGQPNNPVTGLSTYDFVEHTDANGVRVLDQVIPKPFLNNNDPNLPSADTDWQKEVFRPAATTQNNITLTAGTKRSTSLMSLGYYTNSGLAINNEYKRFNARINNSMNFFDAKLKIGENMQLIRTLERPTNGVDNGTQATWNDEGTARTSPGGSTVIALTNIVQPILPVRKLDGTFAGPPGGGFSDRQNPVALADLNKWDRNNDFQLFGNMYAELTPIDNLVLRSSFGLDYTDNYDINIEPSFSYGFLNRTAANNNMSIAQRHRVNWTFSNTARYSMSFGKSRVNFLAGMEAISNFTTVVQAQKLGYAVEDQSYYTLSSGTGVATSQQTNNQNKLLSYFGQVGYAFNDKYLVNATLRYDGASRFGANNKFGLFPAASVGWNLSKETFMQSGLPVVSNLKLRVGYGRVGNQEIGNYGPYTFYRTNYGTINSTLHTGTAYDINQANSGTLPSGYVRSQTGNPDLKWETTDELNLGLDFGFGHQKITGTFDYFSRTTSGILITPTTPGVLGEGARKTVNGATVVNHGFEFLIAYNDSKGDFTYGIEANAARFMDKVTDLPLSVARANPYPFNAEKTVLGRSKNSVLGYVADGLFQTTEEVTNSAIQTGKGLGRIRYKDLNGDGRIDALDQDWLGTTLPGFTYGFNLNAGYKRFSLTVFTRGVAFITVNDGNIAISDFFGSITGVNHGARLLNAWTQQNSSSVIPAASNSDPNTETKTSTYNRVRGDYFKVQNIQLDYRLPLTKWKLTSARVYVIADNALLFFKKNGGTGMDKAFTGPDPETPGTTYPRPIRFTLGFDVKF